MPEEFEEADFPLSTADATGPARLEFAKGSLELSFRDWTGRRRRVVFRDVAGFRWSLETSGNRADLLDDLVYEVKSSTWIRALAEANALEAETEVHHLVIGFNEEGASLEVVCESFDIVS